MTARRQQRGDQDSARQRNQRAHEPVGLRHRKARDTCERRNPDGDRGKRDAETDAAEMHRRHVLGPGGEPLPQHDPRDEDHRKGARQTRKKADDGIGEHRGCKSHGGQQQGRRDERRETDPAFAAVGPAIAGKHRACEISDEIRRGDQARISRRKAGVGHHRRQNGRIGEPAEAHGYRHGDRTGDRGRCETSARAAAGGLEAARLSRVPRPWFATVLPSLESAHALLLHRSKRAANHYN